MRIQHHWLSRIGNRNNGTKNKPLRAESNPIHLMEGAQLTLTEGGHLMMRGLGGEGSGGLEEVG